ncbi:MAG: tetratricopeptide repeat protein [Candidatus Poribacteria bacterium]
MSKLPKNALTVHVLGEGIGESIILELPNGKWGIVDCYTRSIKDETANQTLNFLKQSNVQELEFLCLSHMIEQTYQQVNYRDNLSKRNRSFLQFGFILIIVASFILGCADNPQVDIVGAEQNLQTGWLEYNNGNYNAALLSFERAISLDDSLSDAHNGLGYSLLSSSASSAFNPQLVLKALSAFQEAIRLDETNADAWVGLANALFLRRTEPGDFKTAVQALDNALKGNSAFLYRHDYNSEADIHALKAICLYYAGDVQAASSEVESALEIDSENQQALAIGNFIKSSR